MPAPRTLVEDDCEIKRTWTTKERKGPICADADLGKQIGEWRACLRLYIIVELYDYSASQIERHPGTRNEFCET